MIRIYSLFDAKLSDLLRHPQQLVLLLLRCYLAWIFFKSGLLKIQSWESTLQLFEFEYAVPYLSPYLAAVLGTAAELILPPLFVLGLGTRVLSVALFFFNIVAWISYPDLSPAGEKDHQLWAAGFTLFFFLGAGKLSLDHLLLSRANPMKSA